MTLHHIAIICSDYARSLAFYTQVLGLEVIAENYRPQRKGYKTDLALNGQYLIELFSFPDPPKRPSYPEAAGLRHIAFLVDDLDDMRSRLASHGIEAEPTRVDPLTGTLFFFAHDPDGLPIEFCQHPR